MSSKRSNSRPRESDRKDAADVKRENHHLKRALARAEKQVQKLLENSALEVEVDPEPMEKGPATVIHACPTCEQGITIVAIGPKTLKACKNCGWRKVE